jgi:hypothetical protein
MDLMVTIKDADVAEMSKSATFLEKPVSGRFDALLSAGYGDDRTGAERIVAGKADIKDGNIWEFPALLGVLSVLSLKGADRRITAGTVRFLLKDDRIIIEQLDFEGHPLCLYGSGWVDLTGQNLELTFVPVGHMLPVIVRPVEALTWLIGGSLFPVVVTGSWADAEAEVGDKSAVPKDLRKMAEERKNR